MNPLKLFRGAAAKTYDVLFPTWDSKDNGRLGKKSDRDFLRYNQISLYTNRAIDKRAEKVGEVAFQLKKGDKIIERHALLDLLNRPNQFHTGRDFWKLYEKYLDITGRAFIYLHSEPRFGEPTAPSEMHLLRSDCMKVLFDDTGSEIIGYEYTKPNSEPKRFEKEDILYAFRPDPMNPLEGESLLRAGIREINTGLQLADYHSRVLANGGRIDGVFHFEEVTAQQLKELKESYQDQYGDAKKAGLPLFLGGKSKYERLSLSPEELSFLETKKVTLNDICLMTGVPPAILTQTSQEKYDNADAAHTIFLRETIKPLLESLVSTLDWRLIPKDLDLTFIDQTPEDIDRKIKVIKAAHETNAVSTDEKREMLGLDPFEGDGADDILVPFNLVPLGKEHEKPQDEPEEEEKQQKTIKAVHPLQDAAIRRKYAQIVDKRLTRRESIMDQAMVRYFDGQRQRLLERIRGAKTFRRKDMLDESFDLEAEIRLASGVALPLIEQFLKDAGQDAIDLLEGGYDFVLATEIRTWLDNRAHLFAREITHTTFEKLKDQFSQSIDAGESRQELIDRIMTTYDGFTEKRATTIARTEVHAAMQKGTFEGYRQVNVPIKIWVTVGDADVRHTHAAQDGDEVPFNQPFANGLMFPGDPEGPASEVINCRCSI